MSRGQAVNPIIYYDLRAVRKSDLRRSDIATAACVTCIATGRILDGMGGPGYALSPDIVDALDMAGSGPRPKTIVDSDDLASAVQILEQYTDRLRSQLHPLLADRDKCKNNPLWRGITDIEELVTRLKGVP